MGLMHYLDKLVLILIICWFRLQADKDTNLPGSVSEEANKLEADPTDEWMLVAESVIRGRMDKLGITLRWPNFFFHYLTEQINGTIFPNIGRSILKQLLSSMRFYYQFRLYGLWSEPKM